MVMSEQDKQYLQEIEDYGAQSGWVEPINQDDRDFLTSFRSVCKRYNIVPSKATKHEYDFVTRVAESEFYLQRAHA